MKYIIIIFIIALIAYIIWARTSTSLQLENGKVLLQVDRESITLDTTIIDESYLDFATVTITQTVLRDSSGALLVFERAVTDELYQFDHRTKAQLMKSVFGAKQIVGVYEVGNLAFFQVLSDGDDALNLIVHQSDDDAIRFVYGFSDREFRGLVKRVAPSGDSIDKAIKAEALIFDDQESAVHTKWNTPLHTIESLIIPLDSSS